jgi:LCP family protein required for cell wall assembly
MEDHGVPSADHAQGRGWYDDDNRVVRRNTDDEEEVMRRARRILLLLTALVTALVLGVVGIGVAWFSGVKVPIASGATYMRVSKFAPTAVANQAGAPPGQFFILLVGNDLRPGVGGARGDSLHLVGVNPQANQATMLNIPRDTCWRGDKINAANTRGVRSSADAVGGLIGVPISYALELDFAGFTSLVDGIGGVDVNVPMQMHDIYTGANFSPGLHHMNGDDALKFSRDRHDFPNSDITRTANQGGLILDAMRQLQTRMQNAPGEFRLMALLGRHARLDGMSLADLYRLGRVAFRLNPNAVRSVTIPIGGGNCLSLGGGAASLFADFRDDAILESH